MAVIPLTVVELRLQIGQFLFGSVKAFTFLVGRVLGAPHMVQIGPYLQKHTGPPLIAAVATVTVVIPILLLRGGTPSKEHQERHGHQSGSNRFLHNPSSLSNYLDCPHWGGASMGVETGLSRGSGVCPSGEWCRSGGQCAGFVTYPRNDAETCASDCDSPVDADSRALQTRPG